MKASAFLALWNGISGEAVQAEYEAWHTFEHVPERVSLPGFIEARRYRSLKQPLMQPLRYYTCYWLESGDALQTPAYRDIFTNPTPWSARIRGHMRDFFRMPCGMGGMHGNSSASRMMAMHLQSDDDDAAVRINAALEDMVFRARLVSAQWGQAQPTDDYPLANRAASVQARHQFVVMLGHLDDAALTAATQSLLQRLAPQVAPVSPPDHCEFLSQVRQADLTTPSGQRPAPRMELMARFTQGDNP